MQVDAYWLDRAAAAAAHQYPNAHANFELLPPHGSLRRYVRVSFNNTAPSKMLMLLPPRDAHGPEAGTTEDFAVQDSPFVQIAQWLQNVGVRTPLVYAVDEHNRAIWLEDLGDQDLDQALQAKRYSTQEAYGDALQLLAQFQNAPTQSAPPHVCQQRKLDAELLFWELNHYVEWRLQKRLYVELDAETRRALNACFYTIVQDLTQLPQVTVHRDFQSHNIMCPPDGRFALIDFQDCLQGPLPYDAVALLRDSYIELDVHDLRQFVRMWADNTRDQGLSNLSVAALTRAFHLQTIQRKLKDTGRFEFFDLAQNKSGFLQYRQASVRYVRHALEQLNDPSLAPLFTVLSQHEPMFHT